MARLHDRAIPFSIAEAAAAGNPDAPLGLARWLSQQPGREADTEQAYSDALPGPPKAPAQGVELQYTGLAAAAGQRPHRVRAFGPMLADEQGRRIRSRYRRDQQGRIASASFLGHSPDFEA